MSILQFLFGIKIYTELTIIVTKTDKSLKKTFIINIFLYHVKLISHSFVEKYFKEVLANDS